MQTAYVGDVPRDETIDAGSSRARSSNCGDSTRLSRSGQGNENSKCRALWPPVASASIRRPRSSWKTIWHEVGNLACMCAGLAVHECNALDRVFQSGGLLADPAIAPRQSRQQRDDRPARPGVPEA